MDGFRGGFSLGLGYLALRYVRHDKASIPILSFVAYDTACLYRTRGVQAERVDSSTSYFYTFHTVPYNLGRDLKQRDEATTLVRMSTTGLQHAAVILSISFQVLFLHMRTQVWSHKIYDVSKHSPTRFVVSSWCAALLV